MSILRTPTKLNVMSLILTLSFVSLFIWTLNGEANRKANDPLLTPLNITATGQRFVGTTASRTTLNDLPSSAIIDQFRPTSSPPQGQDKTQREVRFLPFPNGSTIDQPLGKGEVHVYVVELKSGEALRVDITEKGVDCVLALSRASDREVKRLLNLNFGDGTQLETFTYVANESGSYIVAVAPNDDSEGTYVLTGSVKPAGRMEQLRAEAVRCLDENLQSGLKKVEKLSPLIQNLESCVQIWKELREDFWIGHAASELSSLYKNAGQIGKAIDYAGLALTSLARGNDRKAQALASSNLGVLCSMVGRHQDALKYLSDGLAIFRDLHDESSEAWTLNQIGVAYGNIGKMDTAIEYYLKALSILKTVKSVRIEARVYDNLGVAYAGTGKVDKAATYLNQALVLSKQITDPNFQADILDDVADFYSQIGELQRALEYGRQALSLYQASGDRRGEAGVEHNLGEFYLALGERLEAKTHLEKAVALYQELEDDLGLAQTLETLSDVTGDERALKRANEILSGKDAQDPQLPPSLLLKKANQLKKHGDIEAAVQAYLQTLDISRTINNPHYEAQAWISLADLYVRLNDSTSTLNSSVSALLAAKSYGDPETEAEALLSLMAAWSMAGNRQFALATFYGKQALNRFQAFRARVRRLDAETQKSYVRRYEVSYIGLTYILLWQGRNAEALEVINAARDQQFYDTSRNNTESAKPIALTPQEAAFLVTHDQILDRGVALGRQIGDLRRQAGNHPTTAQAQELAKLDARMDKMGTEFSAALQQAATDLASPRRTGEEGEGAALAEIRSTLRQLSVATGQRTVGIYVLVGAGGHATLLVTPDSVTASPVVEDDKIDNTILQYYDLLQSPAYDPRPLGKKLYDAILKPIEPALQEAKAQTILWSLGGTLRYVPMASLWDGEHYLVERYQSVVFTRADKERMTRADSPIWVGAGFGTSKKQSVHLAGNTIDFSGLPGVSQELGIIFNSGAKGGIPKGEVFINRKFTKESFLGIARHHYALVHVASHFSFRPGDDTQSFLVLGDGTALTLSEMKQQPRLFEGVELLTLSACDTAALRPDAMGREVDAFAESAQRLGAGAVMATLWTVADESTPILMREFYSARQNGESLSKAHALQQAQLALLNGNPGGGTRKRGAEIAYAKQNDATPFEVDAKKPFAHPYYWAPFILIGNGR